MSDSAQKTAENKQTAKRKAAGLRQISVWISQAAFAELTRRAAHSTKAEVIEQMLGVTPPRSERWSGQVVLMSGDAMAIETRSKAEKH